MNNQEQEHFMFVSNKGNQNIKIDDSGDRKRGDKQIDDNGVIYYNFNKTIVDPNINSSWVIKSKIKTLNINLLISSYVGTEPQQRMCRNCDEHRIILGDCCPECGEGELLVHLPEFFEQQREMFIDLIPNKDDIINVFYELLMEKCEDDDYIWELINKDWNFIDPETGEDIMYYEPDWESPVLCSNKFF